MANESSSVLRAGSVGAGLWAAAAVIRAEPFLLTAVVQGLVLGVARKYCVEVICRLDDLLVGEDGGVGNCLMMMHRAVG
jgi:hypothetical protein